MPLTVDELYRRVRNQQYGKQELLWVASTAKKSIRHGLSMYRFVVDRNETGIFVGLNDESEYGIADYGSGVATETRSDDKFLLWKAMLEFLDLYFLGIDPWRKS